MVECKLSETVNTAISLDISCATLFPSQIRVHSFYYTETQTDIGE